MALSVTFHGGADSVTGSNFLIKHNDEQYLVDCGMTQGSALAERKNADPFAYDPKDIDALIITHAHLDHIGRAPLLIKHGFTGPVYMSEPTRDLMSLMLTDAVSVMTIEGKRFDSEPLYTLIEVELLMSRVKTLKLHEPYKLSEDVSITLFHTGHILGATSVLVHTKGEKSLLITGDIGSGSPTLLTPFDVVPEADVIVMESVYGDRENSGVQGREELLRTKVVQAVAKGGALIIPAFSVERTQLMLYELSNLFSEGLLKRVPVFLDSPLAIKVTDVYKRYARTFFNEERQKELLKEQDLFSFPFLTLTSRREESEKIKETPNPKIIIAGAGMSHGGRIGKHEILYLPDERSTLFVVGYQAPGTLGRQIEEGVKAVTINKRKVKVRARVEKLTGWSGHADSSALLAYASAHKSASKFIIVQGEPQARRFLAQRITNELGKQTLVPEKGDTVEI